MKVRHALTLIARVIRMVTWIVRYLLRQAPGRVLWVRALDPKERPRWTSLWRLLTGNAVPLIHGPPPVSFGTSAPDDADAHANVVMSKAVPVAVAVWHAGAVRRVIVSAADAVSLAGRAQSQVAAHLEGAGGRGGKHHHHHLRRHPQPRLLGVSHNYFDVTAAMRPWFFAVSAASAAVTAEGVSLLLGLRASRHVVEALWDDMEETTAEGGQPLRPHSRQRALLAHGGTPAAVPTAAAHVAFSERD